MCQLELICRTKVGEDEDVQKKEPYTLLWEM